MIKLNQFFQVKSPWDILPRDYYKQKRIRVLPVASTDLQDLIHQAKALSGIPLTSLDSKRWLYGDIINIFANIVKLSSRAYPNVCVMPTEMYSASFETYKTEEQLKRTKSKCISKETTVIIFPLHVRAGLGGPNNHWALVHANKTTRDLVAYDSMGLSRLKELQNIQRALKFTPNLGTTDITWNLTDQSNQDVVQKNDYDCGVFVCALIEIFLTGGDLEGYRSLDTAEYRKYIRNKIREIDSAPTPST